MRDEILTSESKIQRASISKTQRSLHSTISITTNAMNAKTLTSEATNSVGLQQERS